MRLFVCSDIHGNLRAFDAVLADYREIFPCELLFLGDAVGYGAHPDAVLDRLLNLPRATLILGNHDWALLDKDELGNMNDLAARGIAWTESRLGAEYREEILERFSFLGGDDRYVAAHATPLGLGDWTYIHSRYTAGEIFDKIDDSLCFIGHTHIPIVYNSRGEVIEVEDGTLVPLEPGVRYIVNPGSVGQPRDGDARASFVVCDFEEATLSFHRRAYDIEAEASDIIESGLPPYFAKRLRQGG